MKLFCKKNLSCIFAASFVLLCNAFEGEVVPNSPKEIEAYTLYNVGVEKEIATKLEDAAGYYKQALHLKPDLLQAHNNLGGICSKLNDLDCASQHYQELKALSVRSGDLSMAAAAYNNLGLVEFRKAKQNFLAIRENVLPLYDKALSYMPEFLDAIYNKGSALQALGDEKGAYRLLTKVLEISPDHAGANTNMGNLHLKLGNLDKAVYYHQKAATTENGVEKVNMLNNLGQSLKEKNDIIGALNAFEKARQLVANDSFSIALVHTLIATRSICNWTDWAPRQDIVYAALEKYKENYDTTNLFVPPYDMLLMPDIADVRRNQFIKDLSTLAVQDLENAIAVEHIAGNFRKKISIGYLSYDMNDHPMGFLTHGLLANHNKSAFHVSTFSYGIDDGSVQRGKIISSSDNFFDIALSSNMDAAQTISKNNVDVLFDLMAHTRGGRPGIVALKPASIIVNYLGYPGTSGFSPSKVNYILVDSIVVPPEHVSREVSEKAFYLPNSYQANEYSPDQKFCSTVGGNEELLECLRAPRSALFGADNINSVVFANFNTITKIEPKIFSLWMRILLRVPNGILWLLKPKGNQVGSMAIQNIKLMAASYGVNPNRIFFAKRVKKFDHINRITSTDVFLDTYTYGAHSTASDIIWSGVPFLTISGSSFPSRVGESILNAVGLNELVTSSLKEFEDMAVRIGTDQELRLFIRRKLGSHLLSYPFFISKLITKYTEAAVLGMMELKSTHNKYMNAFLIPNETLEDDIIASFQDEIFQTAMKLHEQGQFSDAKVLYSRLAAQKRTVHGADVWHLLGIGLKREDYVHQATVLKPDIAVYQINLGHIYRENGNLNASLLTFVSAIRLLATQTTTGVDTLDNTVCAVFESSVWLLSNGLKEDKIAVNTVLSLYRTYASWIHETCKKQETALGFSQSLEELSLALWHVKQIKGSIEILQIASKLSEEYGLRTQNMEKNIKHMQMLGSLYTEMGLHKQALSFHEIAVVKENQALLNVKLRRDILSKIPRSSKPVLAIYCHEYGQSWWPKWGPHSPDTGGVGGSEEAVIFIARELRQWFQVFVYADPPEEDYGIVDGVIWMPHTTFDVNDPPDIFVAWRYHISLALSKTAKASFLWLQDMVTNLTPQMKLQYESHILNGIFVLSRFHRESMPIEIRDAVFITPNALREEYFVNGNNLPNELIYASAPNRGLEQVLELWPLILAKAPNTNLRIFYGFSQSFMKWGRRNIDDFYSWKAKIEKLMEQPNVHYYGMVQHQELAEAYARAGFAVYPTSFPETGCVSLMKAQAMGAVPITSRYQRSTLPELCGLWDLGPPSRNGTISNDKEWQLEWADSVIQAIKMPPEELNKHRIKMKKWARRELLWSSVARKWKNIIDEFILNK